MKDITSKFMLIIVVLFCAQQASLACEISYDEDTGIRAYCKLSEFFDHVDEDLVIQTPPPLALANLKPKKLKINFNGNFDFDFELDVKNSGVRDAGPFDATMVVNLLDPQLYYTDEDPVQLRRGLLVYVPLVAKATTERVYLGSVSLPLSVVDTDGDGQRDRDFDFFFTVYIDPPENGYPLGRVWESNEIDNADANFEHCRLYGPNANPTIQPCSTFN